MPSARGFGAADRDRRGIAGYQFLARRPRAGVRRDARKGFGSVRSRLGNLYTYDGELLRAVAVHGDARLVEWLGQIGPFRPAPGQPIARMLEGDPSLRITDLTEDEAYHSYPMFRAFVDMGGLRSSLGYRLAQGREAISVCYIFIARKSGRSPTSKSRCWRTSRRRRSSRWRTRG